ncbi:MAG: SPW repeat protein [candidate division NC10 bacterium]|nr:SPW repeat protein [candidate division NC10 bacterium]
MNLGLGFWLTGAPLMLGFREHGVPALNDVIVGLLLLDKAAATLYLDRPEPRRTPDRVP